MANDLDLTTPVIDRLLANAAVQAFLPTYTADSGGSAKAVFSTDRVPGDAGFPFIHSSGQIDDTPEDIKNTRFRVILRDIGIFDLVEDRSSSALDDIAEKVRNLFNRGNVAAEHPVDGAMTVAGFKIITMEASGPVVAPTDEEVMGRIITLTIVLEDLS